MYHVVQQLLICTPVLELLGYRLLLQGNVGEINASQQEQMLFLYYIR